jgi:uncharacterized protein YndB with AHSA1/START domain
MPPATALTSPMQKKFNILINADIEIVFSCFEDENKIHNWMEGRLTTEFTTARDPKSPVGAKFKQRVENLIELEGEVIAYQSPILLGIGWKASGLKGTITYNFLDIPENKTKISCDLEIFDGGESGKSDLALLLPLFHDLMKSQLKGIKKLSEQE